MAIDGSFSLESALERFLALFPKLGGLPHFDYLAKKGNKVTEEEVVNSVAEISLHPHYTIPLIGCFRPIARKIVDKAVALLRLVPNLRSVLTYFKFAPPPFERLMKRTVPELSPGVISHYLNAARTSYRLLVIETEILSKLWDWSCFLDLVQKFGSFKLCNDALKNDIADIRWCGVQILSIILRMSDRAVVNFGIQAEESISCLLRWEEFCRDTSLEKACSYIESSDELKLGSSIGDLSFNQENCFQSFGLNSLVSSQVHEIEPSTRRRRLEIWDNKSDGKQFVLTSALKRSFEVALLAVSQKWPVLLYGPTGSGKSALVSKLAQESGNQVLSIHMDDQIDGKTLIGSYVCTEQPGEFRWQPGSLTQAILNGYWVVFEDIDKAPSDVQSILLPLLEGSSSFAAGYGEEIRVPESFRLFSTISTSKLDASHSAEGASSIGNLWRRVMIMPPSNDDLQNIVKSRYPNLEPLAERLIETFERVNSYPPHLVGGFQPGNSASHGSFGRFSLRDLLKWCKRIACLDFSSRMNGLSAHECHYIYQEAVDIFGSFSTSVENRLTMMKELAKMWAVPVSMPETLYPSHEPVIQKLSSELRVGRVSFQSSETVGLYEQSRQFVNIRSSLHVLEKIACSVRFNEPVLLVGETGTGKTTLVQNLAMMLGQRLTVLNLSQQSDVADLLGGFKPMDARFICTPLYKEFEYLFSKTFSMMENNKIFSCLQKIVNDKEWKKLLKGLQKQIASSGMIFSFVEGAFVTALRKGEWILLDEVNLAPPETLQRIIGVLEGDDGSLCLAERGDVSYISRHPNFRIFACMNPATDAGKRDLPYSLRSRFTEFFVDDILDDKDLELFIERFLGESRSNRELVEKIRCFYKAAKKESEEKLQDGANQKPQYSLRSLYRALEFTRKAERKFGFRKALYDGFCMFFLTLLDGPSAKIMKQMIEFLLGKNIPAPVPFDSYLIINRGTSMSDDFLKNYVLTKSVKEHLSNLGRAIFVKRYPILLQGPTSSGKTSLVKYLAAITGHEFVRINNHEHTDLQEYLGSYITDASGRLVFHEGVLVKAVRNGHWIVLDELNLAPSDVLEALNRLLDDNRELFVPELCETIKAHPDFMLFATQNPPTFYGGRKMLSRAFRNRFVEIHVDEIPENELSTILEKRCEIPETYAKKMVEVMKELQLHRQSSKVFAGKHGFITPRDLFRWASRFKAFGKSYEDLGRDGYYLLAERLRDEGEKCVVQDVLERHLRIKLVKDDLYPQEQAESDLVSERLGNVIWTRSMWRLYFLVKRCYELREPVLLVGETGGGKTTVCQLLSLLLGSKLRILNCHQYTETSDFIGGFYPVRDRSRLMSEFRNLIEQLRMSKVLIHYTGDSIISSDIGQASSTLDKLAGIIKCYREGWVSCAAVTPQDLDSLKQLMLDVTQLHQRWQTIFIWHDGPLVEAMKDGSLFLMDEISLADDSVLERLNSVLEPERKLSLAEKGGSVLENVTAHENFFVLATMNPGGDYGKKELSPALRNRFTEIWVPSVSDMEELRNIALQRIANPGVSFLVDPMLNFWEWFSHLQIGRTLTVRDLLAWVAFINVTERNLEPTYAFLHGVFLILLDGLSLGTGISKRDAEELRKRCLTFLLEQLKVEDNVLCAKLSTMENYGWGDIVTNADIPCGDDMQCDNIFGIHPFYIEKGYEKAEAGGFEFLAPTTRRNALRVIRAMQLSKPVLLEGSPGVGKTSLIVALGKYSGHNVVRINLSEQTDIMDLLGSDLPVESGEGMKFAWSDGILLQAIKEGCWVLLDELNLAPQSVLEGLNAILDHRGEVFIPELGLTFRVVVGKAFQGPFSTVSPRYMWTELVEEDYLFICSSLYPSIARPVLSNLVLFNKRLHEETMVHHKFAQDGSPWEFNIRDVIRSCQIIEGSHEKTKVNSFLNILYLQRMRTAADRREVIRLYEQVFGVKPFINPYPRVQFNPRYLIVGNTAIKRNYVQSPKVSSSQLKILPGLRHSLEAAAHCVNQQWLCILVGPPSSGKTSLIRLLAQLTGNVLNELNLSSATDISELLGCFEQYNAFRNFRLIVAQVESYLNEYCSLQLEASMETIISGKKDLISRWLSFSSSVDFTLMLSSPSAYTDNWKSIGNYLSLLVEIVEKLRLDLENNDLPLSWSSKELDRTKKTILKLQDNLKLLQSAKFEWITGSLIKAIENGEWIVLENANLCNPTVLDRINSLVEPCGTITVNECGTIDGKPVVLQPHPNFRMFLTINPGYGEVSRAMRNRGVEIYMMPPYWLFDEGRGFTFEDSELKDVERFLVLSGIPASKLVESMSKAHIYARVEGLHFNKSITYLELARWVQLFQQLLMNGNQPMWSLQISWEQTYLSSLGEGEGEKIINHASNAYLSMIEYSESDSSFGYSLCVPGGWPMPLKVRDVIWYSREASVRQNCMYLEFLGAQYASCEFQQCWTGRPVGNALTASNCALTYLMNVKTLQGVLFPKVLNATISTSSGKIEYDPYLVNKMLLFAANWTIEQATESDFQLHLLWLSWFSSHLQPYCPFFNSFLTSLKTELEDQIWKDIFRLHRQLIALQQVDLDLHPISLLSMELVDLTASVDASKVQSKLLCHAINCVDLLRRSYQQWNAESEYDYKDEAQYFQPFLHSLSILEKQLMKLFVESPSFDKLLQLCTDLLEDHILFWNSVTSSQFDFLLISWRTLMKDAKKLLEFCPREVEHVLMEGENLGKVSSWHFRSERSLLWVHGGHPFLPRSAKLYHQEHQLLKLIESVWQQQVSDSLVDVVASSNPELRSLALQGLCMSSYIACKSDEDDLHIAQQLEQMYQMLMKRFGYEKCKLEANLGHDQLCDSDLSSCCVFRIEVLCKKPWYDGWLDTLPINDSASWFLDMELLQELSQMPIIDHKELQLALGSVSHLLESALKYSLNSSTRPPQTFVPHQKLLWTLDAWMSMDAVNVKVASFVLEMWFWWHSFLWSYHPASLMSFSKTAKDNIPLPQLLVQPVKTAVVFQILQSIFSIKDYSVYGLKLKVASHNLWESPPPKSLPSSILSMARSLFHQILYAHKKSFGAGKFAEIKSILCAFGKGMITQENIHHLSSLIASSSHRRLKSLVHLFIEPLLRELYVHCSPTGFHSNLGFAWLRIGGLRFHLLLSCDGLDPAMKYSWKCSQLEEKISLLELEIKVRQECEYLAGWSPSREADKKRAAALQMLEVEHKRLQRKIVFRPDPVKFKALKKECDEFLELVNSSMNLAASIAVMDLQQAIQQVCNWQETASSFVNRLSEEYPEFIDLAQPVQVAVYEMKLGLSIVLSSALQKEFLERIEDDADRVMDSIYSFMRFPRAYGFGSNSVDLENKPPEDYSPDLDMLPNLWAMDISSLEKLVTFSSDTNAAQGSVLQLRAAVHQNILIRVAHSIANARWMDKASFMLLDRTFSEFTSIWMNMKDEVKTKESHDSQQYKFRPRAFKIDRVFEVDKSNVSKFFADATFSEWEELLSEEEITEKVEADDEHASLEEEWNLMQESILDSMVNVHNQLFGSIDLVFSSGIFRISDADRLLSFTDSYTLGVEMFKGLEGQFSSTLDAKLSPEHLLRICLEYEKKFVSSHNPACKYNFYKDSNAPVMAKMVNLLTSLRQRVLALLSEWEEHPGLQKILDLTKMLLAIPLMTPLAKPLSGLQILLNQAQMLQENGMKFPLSDLLEPISALVTSWQKMEFESWPALLDEVQDQYEKNASKLWFPLFSVLEHTNPDDVAGYDQSTIQSLEEFIQTSSIGTYSSPWQEESLKILYNVFGFYVQFLPVILEHIGTSRKNIEKEVRELLKLCRWEHCMPIDNLRRTRQKLKKLVQKYTEVLQQPAMLILNQDTAQKGMKILSIQGLKAPTNISDGSEALLSSVLDLPQFNDDERCMWYYNWRKKVGDSLKNMQVESAPELCSLYAKGTANAMKWLASQSENELYAGEWKGLWHTLENICRSSMDCSNLWKDVNKNVGKKRAFSELLKLLESSGLHKHKFEIMKISSHSNWLFLQPSYDVQHLLVAPSRLSHADANIPAASEIHSLPDRILDTEWKAVNEFYFKSLASVQLLQQICLKHHHDFTSEQTSRSLSFLNHLIVIQQMQRDAAYGFAKQLNRLQQSVSTLESLYPNSKNCEGRIDSECSFAQSQHDTLKCIWQQKQLFDSLYAMLVEESLLVRTVETTHLNDCQNVRVAAHRIHSFYEKFVPIIQKSKESLDNYLLGPGGAIAVVTDSFHCFISKQIESSLIQNFQVINEFGEHLSTFRKEDLSRSSVIETLLSHFDDLLKKGKLMAEQFKSALEARNHSTNSCEESSYSNRHCAEFETQFGGAITSICANIMDMLQKLGSLSNDNTLSEESMGSVPSWEYIYKSCVADLSLDQLNDQILETISFAEKLVNHPGKGTPNPSIHIGAHFKHLRILLDLVLSFSDGFLQDFLAMHKATSVMTHALANILASLFSKGFGIPAKDQEDDNSSHDKPQDASGMGMGEGAGVKDVSDQIEDEDQLLGTSEKGGEEQDPSDKLPSKDEKGIEMEQDFAADTYSVSQDSDGEDSDENDKDEQLESAMGETGADSEVVNEKLWDKEEEEEEENPAMEKEKYESGPSVKDRDESSRELRAKEDIASMADEPGELDADVNDGEKDGLENEEDLGDTENREDLSMDKEEAFADPTGLQLDESNQNLDEDADMDEIDGTDTKEEVDTEEPDESAENGNQEELNKNKVDEIMEEADKEQAGGASEKDDANGESEENKETNLTAPRKDVFDAGMSDAVDDHVPNAESATQPNEVSQASKNVTPETNWSNGNDIHNEITPLMNLPSNNATSQMDIMVAGSSTSGKLTDDQPKNQMPQQKSSLLQKSHANPYRNIGDALEEWKERVNVSVDLQVDNTDTQDEVEDDHADEYGYVSEFDKGTAQALGPATSEQTDTGVDANRPDADNLAAHKDDVTDMEIEKQNSEAHTVEHHASVFRNKMEERTQISDLEEFPMEGSAEIQRDNNGDPGSQSESLISLKKSYLSEELYQLSRLSVSDNEPGKALDLGEVSEDLKNIATALWRRYELQTTRLSQELAEQLRLVMEPTLASKLQGDYKTGKRINMKKVIPYIASHYRKDKIWLRRTKPNKRDYQVVIAVDDSRSMSESGCGDVAIEALVTVCRAMSQLEMGNLSVVSFGKKGNIRSLHDFDEPFTGVAGIKMMSGLTFKQENTIADEPVVDLLMFLNNMLDVAVAKARLPSGQNPLQQLVLIIGDGRFHEKENLKRWVRDLLSKKRMVAFLLVDSPQESIVDLKELSFQGKEIKVSKYLDSFPFPYYISSEEHRSPSQDSC
ncbi:Midasin [Melia azedarach]|uniref:Midasin n=1 Tax=Melia azedarach TaxID=155640 RepID=A0ACC1Y336_MELAZ|nr:Midasin [Melia azedarach]